MRRPRRPRDSSRRHARSRHREAQGPATAPAGPRCHPDRRCRARASGSRRRDQGRVRRGGRGRRGRCPSLGRGKRRGRRWWISSRAGCTRSASPGSGSPGRTRTSDTPGSWPNGSRSSKLAMRGSTRHGDLAARPALSRRALEVERVFGRENGGVRRATARRRGRASRSRCAISVTPSSNRRGIAAELVDDEPLDARPSSAVEHRVGADEAGDDAAAVDVADEHDGHVGGLGETHVGDVAGAEIDLGGAARALDQHEVGHRAQAREAVEHGAAGARLHR